MSEALVQKNDRDPTIQFKSQLDTILYTPVTVENIGRFADDAVESLIALSESVIAKYQKECEDAVYYDGEELEDEAYKYYGLENLNTVLNRITTVRDQIAHITLQVSSALKQTNTVITPPDPTGPVLEGSGSGTYEAPKKLGRLVTLAYILERDFYIDPSSVRYVQGSTTDTMLRQEPYVRVEIEDLKRIVYVCDEEGNASYVFGTEVLEQLGITPPELDNMSKNQRNALLRITPTAGRRIIQTPQWRSAVSTALREPFSETKSNDAPESIKQSEFREKQKFLEFDEFVTAVRRAYKEAKSPGDVQKWYSSVYKKNSGWPATPVEMYKNKGWEGYPKLVGKEVIKMLPFSDFVAEVKTAYEAAGSPRGVQDWYKREYQRQAGWPAAPEKTYKDVGWTSYPELVGKDVVELLPSSDFVAEVRTAYEAAGSPKAVSKWYQKICRGMRRYGWPAGPNITYKDQGWNGFEELIGREKIEWLKLSEFLEEIQKEYRVAGSPSDVYRWYRAERTKHKGWPSHPERVYRDSGWDGLIVAVGEIKQTP